MPASTAGHAHDGSPPAFGGGTPDARRRRPAALFGALVLMSACAPRSAPAQETTLPTWMAGCWESRDGSRVNREDWGEPMGGMMFGLSRSLRDERVRGWEFLRIGPGPEGLTYWAAPSGQTLTAFPATASAEREITFENPDHDFPQRITYVLHPDGTLGASVGTLDGTRGFTLGWVRMDC